VLLNNGIGGIGSIATGIFATGGVVAGHWILLKIQLIRPFAQYYSVCS
jgi:hypothetical protein